MASAHRVVDGEVEAAALAAGAHEHVALPRRLEHRGDLQARVGARHRAQVAGLDDLVADEALVASRGAQAHELALARLERERDAGGLGERAAPRTGGDDRRRARQHAGARAHARSPRRARPRSPAPPRRCARAAARRRARARWRAARTAGRPGRTRRPPASPVSSGSIARTSASVDAGSPARRRRAGAPRAPPRRAHVSCARWTIERALAADAGLLAEAAPRARRRRAGRRA